MSQQKIERQYHIPAKAMLFGEYGVLVGGPALVATLPENMFILDATLLSLGTEEIETVADEDKAAFIFESTFFSDPLSWNRYGTRISSSSGETDAIGFIDRLARFLLTTFFDRIDVHQQLHVRVCKAFAPELGLGSSSALIAGLFRCFDECFSVSERSHAAGASAGSRDLARAWPHLLGALRAAQGRGSGYDVAVQYAASRGDQLFRNELFVFEPKEEAPILRRLHAPWFWKHSGVLMPTGLAAPTREILKKNIRSAELFAPMHASLARRALSRLNNTHLWGSNRPAHPFADLFDESFAIAREQGILPPLEGVFPVRSVSAELVLKTMGAGFGDSLWIINRTLSGQEIACKEEWRESGNFHRGWSSLISLGKMNTETEEKQELGLGFEGIP